MIMYRILFEREELRRLKRYRTKFPRAAQTALAWAMNDAVEHAREVGFAGGPAHLTSRSGIAGLKGSIDQRVTVEGSKMIGTLYAQKVYAAIHEFGGKTRPHIIRAKNARALAFQGLSRASGRAGSFSGGTMFARSVHHPGSVIQARPYLRPALKHAAAKLEGYMSKALKLEGLTA